MSTRKFRICVHRLWFALLPLLLILAVHSRAVGEETHGLRTYVTTGAIVTDSVTTSLGVYPQDAEQSGQAPDRSVPEQICSEQDDPEWIVMKKEIEKIYPDFCRHSATAFEQAHWLLDADGYASVVPASTGDTPPSLGILTGRWQRAKGVVKLHVGVQGQYGLHLFLDAILIPDADGLLAKALLTAEVQGARHVETFNAQLAKIENPKRGTHLASLVEFGRQQQPATVELATDSAALSEPNAYIGGVPLDVFVVTVVGHVDGHAFKLDPSLLRFMSPADPKATALDLQLISKDEGDFAPGWSWWKTSRDVRRVEGKPPGSPTGWKEDAASAEPQAITDTLERPSISKVPEPGVAVTAAHGRVYVAISPSPPPRNLYWAAPDPNHPDETVSVYAETGFLSLTIEDNRIEGTLKVNGRVADGSQQESRLEASVVGMRRGAKLRDQLTELVGLRRFSGHWLDQVLGRIDLTQQGKGVSGELSQGGSISGKADGALMGFTLHNSARGWDRGFIRVIADGSLVGLVWKETNAAATAQSIVAVPEATIDGQAGAAYRFPTPATDADADAIKYLGYDYAHAGKHRAAVDALSKSIKFYQSQAKASGDPREQESQLLEQGVPIYTLIDSAFQAHAYPQLVQGLTWALDLRQQLGQTRSARRILSGEARQAEKILSSEAETLGLLTEAFERAQGYLTSASIGAALAAAQEDDGVVIDEIVAGMPADRAGIAVGDRLMSIDGTSILGMTVKQVSEQLRGKAGTTVSMVISRGNELRDFEVTRAPLARVAPQRVKPLSKSLASLHDFAYSLAQQLTNESRSLDQLRLPESRTGLDCPGRMGPNVRTTIGNEMSDLSAVFEQLRHLIAERRAATTAALTEAIAMAHTSLAGNVEALDLFVRFVDLFKKLPEALQDTELHERLMALNRELEEFEHREGAGAMDVQLLELNGHLVGALINLQTQLASRVGLLEKKWAAAIERAGSEEIQETLRSLAQWLDHWRSRLATDAGKIQALEGGQRFYEAYVKLLIRLGLPGHALAASEAARARAYLDRLSERSKTDEYEPSKLVDISPAELSALLNDRFGTSVAPDLDQILALVQRQQNMVLEYFVTEEELFVWVVTPAPEGSTTGPQVTLQCTPTPDGAVRTIVKRFQDLLEAHLDHNKVVSALHDLHELLIAPVADLLPKDDRSPLIIVPHRMLFSVPFAALARSDASGPVRYLIEDYALVYVPSLGVMKQIQDRAIGRPEVTEPNVLVIVNPAFGPSMVDFDGRPFAPLDQLEADMEYVLPFYDQMSVRLVKGADATADGVLAEVPGKDIVLFATHAEASSDNPDDSYIALADGRLRITDLDQHRFDARLAILAACETGSGQETSDGVEGLARTMVTAGADALLATLWSVPDAATMELLFKFHRTWLDEGRSVGLAQSLRQAQIELLPRYSEEVGAWAGFQMIGVEP